jgi:hypothetical protein
LSPVFFNRYDNVTEAYKGVANGSLWGLLVFPANFSSAYVSRMSAPANADQAIINQSSVLVQLDMSNQQVKAVFNPLLPDGLFLGFATRSHVVILQELYL